MNCIMCQGGFFSTTFSSQVLFNVGLALCINRMYLSPQNLYFLGFKEAAQETDICYRILS